MSKKSAAKKMKLSEEQLVGFRSFTAGANLFLTGKGGTGKSYLTRYIIDWCKEKGIPHIVCAPTGIAAINVGGSTIHKVFRPGKGIIEPGQRVHDKEVLKMINAADVIIIDEISMCRADLFQFIGNTLLYLRNQNKKDGRRHQLLVVGDFYQLPPVLTRDESEAYTKLYGSVKYAFQTQQWEALQLQTFQLEQSQRQGEDKALVTALDNIREGTADFELFKTYDNADPTAITLCGTNKEAQAINERELQKLIKSGNKKRKYASEVVGDAVDSDYPTDKVLTLAIGAKVIMITNDPDKRWVNGTFATVTGLSDRGVTVQIDGGVSAEVAYYEWSIVTYELKPASSADEKPKIISRERARIKQLPMKLAWAISIHKSQGQTYDRVNIDSGNIFAAGQLYVALSRCRTLAGMHIVGNLSADKVMVSDTVKRWMSMNITPESTTGALLPFSDSKDGEGSPVKDRYQEGWDDGYETRSKEFDEIQYHDRLANDPAVKILSERSAREREKEGMAPEERNPHGAGRKPKPQEELKPSKAIRVPVSVADVLKQLGDLAKEHPEEIEERCRSIIVDFN